MVEEAAERDGAKVETIKIPLPLESEEEIVEVFYQVRLEVGIYFLFKQDES